MSRLPNTFIIGAPKCGTTSLARWLGEHPDVFVSKPKEPGFFCRETLQFAGICTEEQYSGLYEKVDQEPIVVDATAAILFDETSLPRVQSFARDARIVVMVRDPVRQIASWHAHCIRQLDENIGDLHLAWAAMKDRRMGRRVPRECRDALLLDYEYIGSIGTQLERVHEFFPKERVYVGFLDDFIQVPRVAWLSLLSFLDVPDDGRVEFPAENIGYMPSQLVAYKVIRKTTSAVKSALAIKGGTGVVEAVTRRMSGRRDRSALDVAFQAQLRAVFEPEVVKLERLTGRDLSSWRSTAQERV